MKSLLSNIVWQMLSGPHVGFSAGDSRAPMQRCETPFLHDMTTNSSANRLNERMGFRTHRESVVRVLSLR